jgi:broad specificity phosphatase PhoE
LTKKGRQTAKEAGIALRSLTAAPWAPAVYSSPYFRCLQTANEIAAELGLLVRVEPGLSELCCARIFDHQPDTRAPQDALQEALVRVEVDCSVAPCRGAVPVWPEAGRDANQRVSDTARSLAARHPGHALVLVCHSHSLVEITRRLPTTGAGAVGSRSGYCAMSHISASGALLACLDQSYLKGAPQAGHVEIPDAPSTAVGRWTTGWRWRGVAEATHEDEDPEHEQRDPVDVLLGLDFEDALERYPRFKDMWQRATPLKRTALRDGWRERSSEFVAKVRSAHAKGIFC